jgi:transposase
MMLVGYGSGLRAPAVYLVVFQLIPIGRAAELISNLCGASVSTGWINAVLGEAHGRLADIDQLIKTLITLSYVVHADETGIKVAQNTGRSRWLHVASTTLLTSLHAHTSRALTAVIEHEVLPGFTGVLVHDSLGLYDSAKLSGTDQPPVFDHQLCGAHLCRELVAAGETHPGEHWPAQAKNALEALNSAAHAAR